MKWRLIIVLVVAASLLLALTWIVGAQDPQQDTLAETNESLTLNLALVGEPDTLDPIKDGRASSVAEQLFVGLVDLDDNTGETRLELATGWTISPDGLVYTFTLRSGITWSDGQLVTAGDVRYGILRSLDPVTEAGQAYALFVIQGAEAYNTGQITDPDQVGVTALDDTHLQITLEEPASYLLPILSMWVARPMPQWAIDAWGDAWTEPAHIVTNGPYRLTEWQKEDFILLDKNPDFYDADNVQIERVKMWVVDGSTAWQMYADGDLDTASVPGDLHYSLDAIQRQEMHQAPSPWKCNYYYAFNLLYPPFDDPLVRKAFIAATNRQGLIDDALQIRLRPALTFTPPGVFGHADGYLENTGIRYNPHQARRWLAEAGYPNGEGLPPITIWHNTGEGHRRIAEYVRDSWYATLGVSATVDSVSWGEYWERIDEFQVWRGGWCPDYDDAYNFLYDGTRYLTDQCGWANAVYENVMAQAILERDAAARRALYRQAEDILVEGDAVMLPLY